MCTERWLLLTADSSPHKQNKPGKTAANLKAVWEHGGCFAFLAFFRLFSVAFEPVDSDNIAFQGNPVRVIQVSMVNKFSHRSLQLSRGYFRIYCQLVAIRGYISFEA
jgi:hypothetical protein